MAIHLIIDPGSFILPSIIPFIDSIATDNIIIKISYELWTITPTKLSLPFFFTIYILTNILWTIWPTFLTMTRLFIFLPFSIIYCSICVHISSVSMRLIIQPLPYLLSIIYYYQFIITIYSLDIHYYYYYYYNTCINISILMN